MSRVLPILFNTEMVQAILDGRKTVTRRLVKLPKYIQEKENGLYTLFAEGVCYENQYFEQIIDYLKKPYQPGDILYVRETWCRLSMKRNTGYTSKRYVYKASDQYPFGEKYIVKFRWHPSIHMPKEAARLWLKVTDVRVERLQEITDEQAKAEGANYQNGKNVGWEEKMRRTAKERFAEIWDSTLKKSDLDRYGWDANPRVWVIEFEKCEKPESEG